MWEAKASYPVAPAGGRSAKQFIKYVRARLRVAEGAMVRAAEAAAAAEEQEKEAVTVALLASVVAAVAATVEALQAVEAVAALSEGLGLEQAQESVTEPLVVL